MTMGLDTCSSQYENGAYCAKHPDWHSAESATKARWLIELVMQDVLPSLHPRTLRIVDVGCGAGGVGAHFAHMLRQHQIEASLLGIDISAQVIEMAQLRWPGERFLRAQVPPEKDFDLALFIDVLEHVAEPAKVLQEAKEYSKRIAVQLPLEDNVLQRLRPGLKFYKDLYGHLHFYHRRRAHRLLQENGWRVEAWRWTGGVVDPTAAGKVTTGTRVRRLLGLISWDMSFRLLGQAAWMAIAAKA